MNTSWRRVTKHLDTGPRKESGRERESERDRERRRENRLAQLAFLIFPPVNVMKLEHLRLERNDCFHVIIK